jgi:hypothetical protein
MPVLSVWMVRTALLQLSLGFTLGGLILMRNLLPGGAGLYRLVPLHLEVLLIGWMVQLAMGVGFWMLPKFREGRPRGREELVWTAYVCLNGGVLMAGIAQSAGNAPALALSGRAAEAMAAVLFLANAWPRIKPFGV